MLNKLRRSSKQGGEVKRKSSAVPTISNPSTTPSSTQGKLTFFSLPAEIRNAIYEDIARDALLRIPLPKEKNGNRLPPIPSLLVVCKQTRNEFLPYLLEYAALRIQIKDFDFRHLVAVSRSLYSTELKALRNNAHLTVELLADRCTKDSLVALRRWLDNRGTGLDRLPWRYGVAWKAHQQILPTSTAVAAANAYIVRKRILTQNLEGLAQLHKNVGEMSRFDLQPIVDAFETELAMTGAEPNSPWRDHAGLMMAGVYGGANGSLDFSSRRG